MRWITHQAMARPDRTNNTANVTTKNIRRRGQRGRLGVSGWGATRFAASSRGLIAEARPAEVLGNVIWSSSPETAPARIGWVWP
ncbi:hypothetical protein A5713_00730 [Mycobacterium sp. E2497]|nr:hypothetical protein A9X04_05270 [Mycobacterium sp. E3247]OBI19519.1 hypothetical protein A5713_00730 [Mycobacterium sp. E2497]